MGSSAPREQSPDHQVHNFLLAGLFQIVQRIGWVFKTESIVMPAFMDFVGGGPVLRGLLPVLNRFGFAVPPVLFARQLKITPRKKIALVWCTIGKALPFAVLVFLWQTGTWKNSAGQPHAWLPWLYLVLYAVFFVLAGIGQLVEQTLQGKLIEPHYRGRLMTFSIMIGAPVSILAVAWLMPGWLAMPDGGFGLIFAMPATLFVVAGISALWLREAPDNFQEPRAHPWKQLLHSWEVAVKDPSFRRLAVVATLFSAAFMLFPHYQALGRERLGLGRINLVFWICAQNSATALASLFAGPLADRFGNRLALILVIFGAAIAPVLAFILGQVDPELGSQIFWVVFLPIGLTPLSLRLMSNYTLEIVDRQYHPRYVSTLGACFAFPVLIGAPLVGWLVKIIGYDAIFAIGAAAMLLAGALTFRLEEPRHRLTESTIVETPRWTE